MISLYIFNNEEKKKDVKEKMVQIIERKKLEEIYIITPKNGAKEKEVEEQKADKKSRLFKKHKKTLSIDKVKINIDANICRNRFIMG